MTPIKRRGFLAGLLALLGVGSVKGATALPIKEKWRCIEAALALRGGLESIDQHYDAATLAVARRDYRNISLRDALAVIAGDGDFDRGDTAALLKASFERRDPVGRDAGVILSNLANKFLVQGFRQVDDSWRKTATIRHIGDFKGQSSHSMVDAGGYVRFPSIYEMNQRPEGQRSYYAYCGTYARMLTVSPGDIDRDDLNAITCVGTQLGRGAALKFNDVFWDLSRQLGGAPIEVAFLSGQEMPVIEFAELNRQSMAIQFRGYYDFGCSRG